MEKQLPYNTTFPADPPVDPMFTEAVTVGDIRSQFPDRKRSKTTAVVPFGSKQYTTPKLVKVLDGDPPAVEPPKRQYLSRSRAAATAKAPSRPLSNFEDTDPSSTF